MGYAQAEPCSGADRFGRKKWIEYLGNIFGGDSTALIRHLYRVAVASHLCGHQNRLTGPTSLNGICQNIADGLI